tara:strand:- start:2304 stop:2519 length:216 start_codon:yes stop_codon:yes gene_type:complete
MAHIKKSITVEYEDNSYGKTEQKSRVFETDSNDDKQLVLKEIEEWRRDGGYVIKNPEQVNLDGFVYEHVED